MGARGTIRLLPGEGADDLLTRATAEHKPIASLCLFSGGGDSAVLAHRCRDAYEALVFIDTGTAVPGVREHVERFAAWLDKPLRVYDSGDAFRRMVLQWGKCKRCAGTGEVHETAFLVLPAGVAVRCPKCDGTGRVPFGFPGPAQHARAYTRLKERQIEAALKDTKAGQPRRSRVMFLTGVRRAESARRATRHPITRRGGAVFVNPLIDWTDTEMDTYRAGHALPESDVAALLHRSGECNCGSFAAPGEREMLRSLWPDWFERTIASLEREAEAAGIPACRWGERPPDGLTGEVGPMCSSCELRLFG